MKSRLLALLVLLVGCGVSTAARAEESLSLLLVPREDVPVRVGMDIGTRYPTLLVSYELLRNGSLSLHGWSGSEWVSISEEAFRNGTFFRVAPADAVIVISDAGYLPPGLVPDEAWCPAVYAISTTEARPLLHLLGRHYNFKYKDWKWFSDSYSLTIDAINPDGLNISWYHRSLGENLTEKEAGPSDLRYLSVLRSRLVEVTPAVRAEELPEEAAEEALPEESGDMPEENPLTNAVPEAVVLGADDVELPAVEPSDSEPSDDDIEPRE